jgi:hypothetical protein
VLQERRDVDARDRCVDELDGMERRHRPFGPAKRSRHLDQAARVAARVGVWLCGEDRPGFAVAEVERRVRLDDVVDSGAAAAQLLVRRLEVPESHPGHRRGAAKRRDNDGNPHRLTSAARAATFFARIAVVAPATHVVSGNAAIIVPPVLGSAITRTT